MKLVDLLGIISIEATTSLTIGTETGQGWIYYWNGHSPIEIDDKFLDREVVEIYDRLGTEDDKCFKYRRGLGIVIKGNEHGN